MNSLLCQMARKRCPVVEYTSLSDEQGRVDKYKAIVAKRVPAAG
jgi:hypothetical protein